MSKDSLRRLVRLNGDFVGTTDSQELTNKTLAAESNIIKSTTPALGNILKDNGTKYVPLTKGSAGLPLRVNDAGTDVGYTALGVAGGGTGVATISSGSLLVGAGTSAITTKAAPAGAILGDSDVQNITGAKTWMDQTFKLRNPANTFTLTQVNPAITANYNTELESPFSYIIYLSGSTCKRMNMVTRAIEASGTTHDVIIQGAIDALGNNSGKSIFIKNGLYTLTASLNDTSINGYYNLIGESNGTQLRPSGDVPAIIVSKNYVNLQDIQFTHNQPAYTSSLLQIRDPSNATTTTRCNFYDFGHKAGSGIGVSNQSTGTFLGMLRHTFTACEVYGFNNAILAEVTAGTNNWITNLAFTNIRCWYPKNASFKASTNVAGAAVDHCHFMNLESNCQPSGANQTVCGFDYDTTGRALYTTHTNCAIIDLGTGSFYAKVNSNTELMLNGCVPSYKIGGSGVSSHKVIDNGYYGLARGTATFSGDASTTDFTITHDAGHFLNNTPNLVRVMPCSADAQGSVYVDKTTLTDNVVVIKYAIPPPTGTNNVILDWEVSNQP